MRKDTATLASLLSAPMTASERQVWRTPVYETSQLSDRVMRARCALVRDGASGRCELQLVIPGNTLGSMGHFDEQEILVWCGIDDAGMLWTRDREQEARLTDFVKRGNLLVPGMQSIARNSSH